MPVRRIVTALAIVFFCLPVALRVVGVTARPFENRPMAERPQLDEGWEVFGSTTNFLVDRMPLREQAVRAHSWTATNVLNTSPGWRQELLGPEPTTAALPAQAAAEPAPTQPEPGAIPPDAVLRDGGWYQFRNELEAACIQPLSPSGAVTRLERLTRAIRRSGRDVVTAVAPDKTTMYPERIPDGSQFMDCAPPAKDALWAAVKRSKLPEMLDLRTAIGRERQARRQPLYFPKDTHWNTLGAAVMVRDTLSRIDDGAVPLDPSTLKLGKTKYTGDLSKILAQPVKESAPKVTLRRPGQAPVTKTKEKTASGATVTVFRTVPGGPPVLPGKTLIIHDSFGDYTLDLLAGHTEQLRAVTWATPTPELIAEIGAADRVIVQSVERELRGIMADNAPGHALLTSAQTAIPRRER